MADNKGRHSLVDEDATFVTVSTASTASTSSETIAGASANLESPNSSTMAAPPPEYYTDDIPPAYQFASALPTYEESELTKGKHD